MLHSIAKGINNVLKNTATTAIQVGAIVTAPAWTLIGAISKPKGLAQVAVGAGTYAITRSKAKAFGAAVAAGVAVDAVEAALDAYESSAE